MSKIYLVLFSAGLISFSALSQDVFHLACVRYGEGTDDYKRCLDILKSDESAGFKMKNTQGEVRFDESACETIDKKSEDYGKCIKIMSHMKSPNSIKVNDPKSLSFKTLDLSKKNDPCERFKENPDDYKICQESGAGGIRMKISEKKPVQLDESACEIYREKEKEEFQNCKMLVRIMKDRHKKIFERDEQENKSKSDDASSCLCVEDNGDGRILYNGTTYIIDRSVNSDWRKAFKEIDPAGSEDGGRRESPKVRGL